MGDFFLRPPDIRACGTRVLPPGKGRDDEDVEAEEVWEDNQVGPPGQSQKLEEACEGFVEVVMVILRGQKRGERGKWGNGTKEREREWGVWRWWMDDRSSGAKSLLILITWTFAAESFPDFARWTTLS